MTISIHPESLKFHRRRNHWTQQQLADATRGRNKVSLPTIKRIESAKKGAYAANNRVAQALAKALRTNVNELSQAPTEKESWEELMRKSGCRPLRTIIEPETNFAFQRVQDIYGISIESQIEMAPLFTAMLAEGSLAWRRKRLEAMEEASESLDRLTARKQYGHYDLAKAAEEKLGRGIRHEHESIDNRDLFGTRLQERVDEDGDGHDWDNDPNWDRDYAFNPFSDYLMDFVKEANADKISFCPRPKTREGFPEYRIEQALVDQLTGGDGDAAHALFCGHVRIKDIPEELLADDKADERVAWLSKHNPEGEIDAIFARQREEFETEDFVNPSEKEAQFQAEEKGEEDE